MAISGSAAGIRTRIGRSMLWINWKSPRKISIWINSLERTLNGRSIKSCLRGWNGTMCFILKALTGLGAITKRSRTNGGFWPRRYHYLRRRNYGIPHRPLRAADPPEGKGIQGHPDPAEPKIVWYCLNCGNENQDGTAACSFCGTERTSEETKTIRYAHDTYSAVHKENISAGRDAGFFGTVTDWLTSLMGCGETNDSAADIPNFRFKAYLKSNLERLYRDENGSVIWMDRNGNTMTP